MFHLRLVVVYCILLHLIWAIAVWMDANASNATALFDNNLIFGKSLPYVLVAVAIMATVSFWRRLSRWWRVGLMLPQQAILMISASSAITAIWSGHFADGVERPPWFLIGDQAPALLAAICHTIAIFFTAIF